jgi:hypothetical protein
MFSNRLWQVLRIALGKKQRFLVLQLGRRGCFRLADFNSRSLEHHLSAFKGPHP